MDPITAAALISGGSSLLGGLFNRNAQKKANKANLPTAQVREWEAAGINPIMGITQGQWIPQQAVSMGDSFANAGGALARGMELNHEEELANTGIRKENEKLKEALSDLSKLRQPSNMESIGIGVSENDPSSEIPRISRIDDLYFGEDLDRLRSRDLPSGGTATWDVNETFAPAESWSDEYGDLVEWGVGLGKLGVDAVSNFMAFGGIQDALNPQPSISELTQERVKKLDDFYDETNGASIMSRRTPYEVDVWNRQFDGSPLPFQNLR